MSLFTKEVYPFLNLKYPGKMKNETKHGNKVFVCGLLSGDTGCTLIIKMSHPKGLVHVDTGMSLKLMNSK